MNYAILHTVKWITPSDIPRVSDKEERIQQPLNNDHPEDDPTLPTTTSFHCGKTFGNARGLRTRQSPWCTGQLRANQRALN